MRKRGLALRVVRAPVTPDAEAALDRLLFELLVEAVEQEILAEGTGFDRDVQSASENIEKTAPARPVERV